ncbi:sulfurtransferase [Lewinellaceae bacterium SD302]|nr:sulfurtransferase [Lewinellaceae bacterium SD302]
MARSGVGGGHCLWRPQKGGIIPRTKILERAVVMYKAIITPNQLQSLLNAPEDVLVFDCHHDLTNPGAGRENWRRNRIANAHFLHLDEDLSGAIIPGQTGRHPLPTKEKFIEVIKSKDFTPGGDQQVVLYDSKFGGIAARAWWMFKWIGHQNVAVLEGGFPAWETYVQKQQIANDERAFTNLATLKTPHPAQVRTYNRAEVDKIRLSENFTLVDSRTPERYRGEHEPIDPVAGHIEGAINLPWPENLDKEGNFKPVTELKSRFAPLKEQAAQNVFYCGSGVTACHNILAYYHAYGEMPGLYAGSWSEYLLMIK